MTMTNKEELYIEKEDGLIKDLSIIKNRLCDELYMAFYYDWNFYSYKIDEIIGRLLHNRYLRQNKETMNEYKRHQQ